MVIGFGRSVQNVITLIVTKVQRWSESDLKWKQIFLYKYYCIIGFKKDTKSTDVKRFVGTVYTAQQCLDILSCTTLTDMQGCDCHYCCYYRCRKLSVLYWHKKKKKTDVHDAIVSLGENQKLEMGCKFSKLTQVLEEKIPIDCKVIVFSEFVQVLFLCKKAIEDAISSGQMKKRDVKVLIGKTSAKKRAEYFELFGPKTKKTSKENDGGGNADTDEEAAHRLAADVLAEFRHGGNESKGTVLLVLFVLGGVGLNLTACHYGIHMEPLYNPYTELQAADRM